MILHRPGCEIFDELILEFSGLLKSYGVDVKMTLIEQTTIDNEGGIA